MSGTVVMTVIASAATAVVADPMNGSGAEVNRIVADVNFSKAVVSRKAAEVSCTAAVVSRKTTIVIGQSNCISYKSFSYRRGCKSGVST